jgi:enoyl-[acyl-carrier protein] reductase I
VVDSSVEGFPTAMDISCHSFVRMANLVEPLMNRWRRARHDSYYGADKVIANYSLMGPVNAALQAAVRYLACELGPKGIRVHAVSPGPLQTRAASGLAYFDELLAKPNFVLQKATSSISSISAPPPHFCARHSPS